MIFLSITVIRFSLTYNFNHAENISSNLNYWFSVYLFGVLISAITWGGFILLLAISVDLTHLSLLIICAASLSAGDMAARFGGEEFALVLPDTQNEHAKDIAEQIRMTLVDIGMTHSDSPIAKIVTASFGVYTTVPKNDCNRHPMQISGLGQGVNRT